MGAIASIPTDPNFSNPKVIREYLFIVSSELSDVFRKNQDKFKFDLQEFFVHMFSYVTDDVSDYNYFWFLKKKTISTIIFLVKLVIAGYASRR